MLKRLLEKNIGRFSVVNWQHNCRTNTKRKKKIRLKHTLKQHDEPYTNDTYINILLLEDINWEYNKTLVEKGK